MTAETFPLLETIVIPSCRAAILIAGLFLLRWGLGNRISPTLRHALWGLVLLALLPLAISSPVSVYNLLPLREPATVSPQGETVETHYGDAVAGSLQIESQRTEGVSPVDVQICKNAVIPAQAGIQTSDMNTVLLDPRFRGGDGKGDVASLLDARPPLLMILYAIGCIFMTFIFIRQALLCRWWLKKATPVKCERILMLYESCRRQMNVKTWLVVAESPAVSGPFLIGAVRPTLLLPSGMTESATDTQLQTVFLHELAHLKRWDVWTGWIATVLLIVHWFNPMLWLAIRRMNRDREEACDALALQTSNFHDRAEYAQSLVDIAKQFAKPAGKLSYHTAGLVGISETGQLLQRRITMINQNRTWTLRWKIFALIAALCLGAVIPLPDRNSAYCVL
jgi:bla regulator protein BlaR1